MVAAAAYFAVFGGDYGIFAVWRLEGETERETAALAAAREEVERLRARADSLETDTALIERLAREQFGLIRPGERLYRFAEPRDTAAGSAGDPNRSP